MTERDDLYAQFVRRFHFGDRPQGANDADLNSMEDSLNTTLPTSYQEFMRFHGKVYTPCILREIVDRALDYPDIQNISLPAEAASDTKAYWSGGMPEEIIGFANDCMGNMFGFKRIDRTSMRPDDLPVWFFDHEFVDVNKVADGFDDLLRSYLTNLPATN